MSLYPKKIARPPLLSQEPPARLERDITWNRPVFHPPQLANVGAIFDPIPFTAHRAVAGTRATGRR